MKRMLAACLLVASFAMGGVKAEGLSYTRDTGLLGDRAIVLLDVRALAQCERRSVQGARCLPVEDLLGPHGSLPDFRQIMWLFGTEGLSGNETVMVLGNHALRRNFVAGLLYLAGQRKVWVMQEKLDTLLGGNGIQVGQGERRSLVADPIFQSAPRDGLIVLREELRRALSSGTPPRLLDGRPPGAYDGELIMALRGGHIPGAESLPYASLLAGTPALPSAGALQGAVAYAADPEHGIAYFTQLRAGLGAPVRVFIGGWREWAAHTGLPADDLTYAEPRATLAVTASAAKPEWLLPLLASLAALGGGMLAAGTLLLTRRSDS